MKSAEKSLILYGASTLIYGTLANLTIVNAALNFPRFFLIFEMIATLAVIEVFRKRQYLRLPAYSFERGVWLLLPSLCYLLTIESCLENLDGNYTPYFPVVHRHFPLLIALVRTFTSRKGFNKQEMVLLLLVFLSCYGSKLTVLIAYDYEFWRLLNAFGALCATVFLYLSIKRIHARLKFSVAELVHVNSFNVLVLSLLEEYAKPQFIDAVTVFVAGFWSNELSAFIMRIIGLSIFGALNQIAFFKAISCNGSLESSLVHASASSLQVCLLYALNAFDMYELYPNALTLIGIAVNTLSTAAIFAILRRKRRNTSIP